MVQVLDFFGNNDAGLQISIIGSPTSCERQRVQKACGYIGRRQPLSGDIAGYCIRLDINNDAVGKVVIYLLSFCDLLARWCVNLL